MGNRLIILLWVLMWGIYAFAETPALSGDEERIEAIVRNVKDPFATEILVIAHRGDWRNAPENSLPAIQRCIDMGVDIVEIDLGKTKDGHLVLMHDKLLNRTTTGKGNLEDYTLAEIKELYLKDEAGNRTSNCVPTLEEAMLLCKNKIVVNIDKGYEHFPEVYEVLKKTGTLHQGIVKSRLNYQAVKRKHGELLNEMIFMPIVNLRRLDRNVARRRIKRYIKRMSPVAIELVFPEADETALGLMERIRKAPTKLWVNSLWPEHNGGHHDDRAVEDGEADESWGWLIEQGATMIQTDRPRELIEYLREKGLKK